MIVRIKPGSLRFPFAGDGLSRAATIALVGLIALGALEPILPLGDTQAIGSGPRLSSPAVAWPLGTDALGRSMLPRILEGILLTFLLSTVAVVVAGVIGAVLALSILSVNLFGDGLRELFDPLEPRPLI